MNNDLEQFSEERLKELAEHGLNRGILSKEIITLARIALTAKQAKPEYHIVRLQLNDAWGSETVLNAYESQLDASKCKDDHGGVIIPCYTTPQPAHAEQDGWIKYQEQKPAANEYISFVSRHGEYASGLVGEDEWVEMHDGTSFELAEIYHCIHGVRKQHKGFTFRKEEISGG